MPSLIIYLIKANIALTLFYLAYRFGLRRLTFYNLNRFFLLSGIAISAMCPLVDINALVSKTDHFNSGVFYYSPDWHAVQNSLHTAQASPVWGLVQLLFWTGVGLMSVRLLIQFASLYKIHRRTQSGIIQGQRVRILKQKINPFSFIKNIYINPALYSEEETSSILEHEKVHVTQWHTMDVLATEINQVFYWFNPGAYLMKKAVKENLEFIADRKILTSGRDARTYQYSLLKLSTGFFPLAIANHFNITQLKNRIKMMNSRKSKGYSLLRYLLFIPVVLLTIFIVRSSEAQKAEPQKNSAATSLKQDTTRLVKKLPPDYYFNSKGYYIRVKETSGETYVLQKNKVETGPYYLYSMNKEELHSFNEKFGSYLTYDELQEHKSRSSYLKNHPDITRYSYSSENRILIWTGNTSKIYDISRDYDRNLLLKTYGSIPPRYGFLNTGEKQRVRFVPPKIVEDNIIIHSPQDSQSSYEFHETFLKNNPAIESYAWKADVNNKTKPAYLLIRLKNGIEEKYDMRISKEASSAKEKYGTVPLPPPPPSSDLRIPVTPPPPPVVKYNPTHDQFKKDYDHFLQRNPSVKSLGWNGSKDQGYYSLIVTLKNGNKERYNLLDQDDTRKAEEKYGNLPVAPPPPPLPAAPKKAPVPPPPPPPAPIQSSKAG